MTITNHRLGNARWQPTPTLSAGTLTPRMILIHFTAGASLNSSANWLCDPRARASAHLLIGKDGDAVQLARFDQITWHAGHSAYGGMTQLNDDAIGLELDNYGPLTRTADGGYRAFKKINVDPADVVVAAHPNGGPERGWTDYTPAQIEATLETCRALLEAYPTIKYIAGHDEVAPARKIDPGPAFDMDAFRTRLLEGRSATADERSGWVIAAFLNVRAGAGRHHRWLGTFPGGTRVQIIDEAPPWLRVHSGRLHGWVHGRYVSG